MYQPTLGHKTENDQGQTSMKARLCAKGYQEQQDFRTNSPTCPCESLCLALVIIASLKWDPCSIDTRTVFQQGTQVYRLAKICPTEEANTDKIRHLNKFVYGLADAARHFYLQLHHKLASLRVTPSPLDQGLYFSFHQDELIGILICHVGDILFGGDPNFLPSDLPLEESFSLAAHIAQPSKTFRLSPKTTSQQEHHHQPDQFCKQHLGIGLHVTKPPHSVT